MSQLDKSKTKESSTFKFIVRLFQLFSIPAASLILFAPSSLLGIAPGASPLLGILVLIVAALSLVGALMSGLKQALGVSFWAALWITVTVAFETDRLLPQPSKPIPTPTPTITLRPIEEVNRRFNESFPKSATNEKKLKPTPQDGLDAITFNADKGKTPTPTPAPGISEAINKAVEGVSAAAKDIPSPFDNDQSIDALPKKAFFPDQDKKKKYFGFGGSDSSGEGGSISSMFDSLISYFTGRK